MGVGLQCFDANGNLTFDSRTDITMRIIGSSSTNGLNGSLTISKCHNERVCIFVINTHLVNKPSSSLGWISPAYSISDNGDTATIYWEYKYFCIISGQATPDKNEILDQDFFYGAYLL